MPFNKQNFAILIAIAPNISSKYHHEENHAGKSEEVQSENFVPAYIM